GPGDAAPVPQGQEKKPCTAQEGQEAPALRAVASQEDGFAIEDPACDPRWREHYDHLDRIARSTRGPGSTRRGLQRQRRRRQAEGIGRRSAVVFARWRARAGETRAG